MSRRQQKTTVKETVTTTSGPTQLTEEDIEQVRQAFDVFDVKGTGYVKPSEIKKAFINMGYDTKNPAVYQIIVELDTPENAKKGIDADTFVDAFNDKLADKESKGGIQKVYDLFTNDGKQDTITVTSLTKVAKELGEDISPEEIKAIISRASNNGEEITFDEFYEIITKTTEYEE